MQVTVRLGNLYFTRNRGPSVRDEKQLSDLANRCTKDNGHIQWTIVKDNFDPQDRDCWGATTVEALRKIYKRRKNRKRYCRRLSQTSFEEDNTIDISPHFVGFAEVLEEPMIAIEEMDDANLLDDLFKGSI